MPDAAIRDGGGRRVDVRSAAEAAVAAALALALLGYGFFALGVVRWWVSGLAAPVVAALLVGRHARARFSAYIFFSVVALRGLATAHWAPVAFAGAALVLMQTPAALRIWPRLGAPARMTRP